MHDKLLRKAMITNMAIWVFAIILPILGRAFASKDPKIFDILMPMMQLMLAMTSTKIISDMHQSANRSPQDDVENK